MRLHVILLTNCLGHPPPCPYRAPAFTKLKATHVDPFPNADYEEPSQSPDHVCVLAAGGTSCCTTQVKLTVQQSASCFQTKNLY